MSHSSPPRPLPVVIAAVLIGALMVWRFGLRQMPGFVSGDISTRVLLGDVPTLLFWLFVVWGLLALQRWAWWISVVCAGLLSVAGLAGVIFAEEIQRHAPQVEPATVTLAAALVGLVAAAVWLLLMLPASRRALVSGRGVSRN